MAFGEHFNVPIIGVSSSTLYPWGHEIIGNPQNLAFVQNTFLNFKESLDFPSRVYNTIHSAMNKLLFDYSTLDQDRLIKKHFGPNASGVRELENKVSMILANSHPSLNGNRPTVPALVEVGGLHVYDEDDKQLSPVKIIFMDLFIKEIFC